MTIAHDAPAAAAAEDSSQQQQLYSNTYSNEVLKLIVARREQLGVTGSADGLPPTSSSELNPEQLREQTCKRRFRVSLFDDDEAKVGIRYINFT